MRSGRRRTRRRRRSDGAAPHAAETDDDSALVAVLGDSTALLAAALAQSPNDDWTLMRVAWTVARERRDENTVAPASQVRLLCTPAAPLADPGTYE